MMFWLISYPLNMMLKMIELNLMDQSLMDIDGIFVE
jgi:hypothetical protein